MNRSQWARRRERREKRRRELSRQSLETVPKTPEDVFSFRNLYRAARVCAKGTLWKSAAMKFDRYRAVAFIAANGMRVASINGGESPDEYGEECDVDEVFGRSGAK